MAYLSPNFPQFHFNKKNEKMTRVAHNFSVISINRKKQTNKQTKADNFSSFVLMKNSESK